MKEEFALQTIRQILSIFDIDFWLHNHIDELKLSL